MVYVGAIMVLFLFAIMLLNFREQAAEVSNSMLFYLVTISFFLLVYFFELQYINWIESLYYFELINLNVDFLYIIDFCIKDISIFQSLYIEYNILLLLVAIVLLIVMVGAISLCLSTKNVVISVSASPKPFNPFNIV